MDTITLQNGQTVDISEVQDIAPIVSPQDFLGYTVLTPKGAATLAEVNGSVATVKVRGKWAVFPLEQVQITLAEVELNRQLTLRTS